MIVREYFKTSNNENTLVITYSDKGLPIRKVGTDEIYIDAIDLESSNYTYEEIEGSLEEV